MMTWYMVYYDEILSPEKYLLCSHMDELEVLWFRDKNRSCRICYYGWDLFSYIYYIMLNLRDHGDIGPHGWLLDTYLKMLFWYDNFSWKECIDAAKNLKAWLLMCLCYNRWMTLEDTTTLFYLSVFQGSIQISQKEAEHCLCLTEDQIWLKYRRW